MLCVKSDHDAQTVNQVCIAHAEQQCGYSRPQASDTFRSLALTYGTTEDALRTMNPGVDSPGDAQKIMLPNDVICPGKTPACAGQAYCCILAAAKCTAGISGHVPQPGGRHAISGCSHTSYLQGI
jgi:hypothetical protein